MVAATIVSAWKDTTNAYAIFRVENDDSVGGVSVAAEYEASTPLLDSQGNPKGLAVLKAELIATASAKRTAIKTATVAVAISGNATL